MPEKLDCRKRCVVVLPSLNPNEKFDRVVDGLREAGFQRILIVDDGSDEQHITEKGQRNGDVDKGGVGITANDALEIQRYLLKLTKWD